ncbi:siderophore-iron reductase FhuF [Methylopila henanensis]|uniref:Siderophore-iron reductase FhuF n=1 Tax=Methylopila henanensis TaxID=873516 RepID=A0ABW4K6B2_9HYPH
MTIPALAPLFKGPLEPFADALTLGPIENARPGADLLDRAVLRELIERLAPNYGDGDRRAVASIWSKSHFSTLMPSALAANLLLDIDLPIAIDRVGIVSDDMGRTEQIVLEHAGEPLSAGLAEHRFDDLIEAHVAPLIAALASVSGASTKVFWSNAGNVFDYVVRETRRLAASTTGSDAGLALMAKRRKAGRPNPLYATVSYPPGGGRIRRVCCLRYLAPNISYCGTCPIAPQAASRHQAR